MSLIIIKYLCSKVCFNPFSIATEQPNDKQLSTTAHES